MSLTIIALPWPAADTAAEYAWVQSHDGATIAAQGSTAAALLPRSSRGGGEVVALVPVAALSWRQVALPRGVPTGRMRAVLEGLLEEHVLEDPAGLHFALQPGTSAGQMVQVAVCSRQWLKENLAALDAAGVRVTRIVPELAPLQPGQTPTIHALIAAAQDGQARIVASSSEGVAVLPPGVAVTGWPGMATVAGQAAVFSEPAAAEQAARLCARDDVQLQTTAQRWLLAAAASWNLAQFEFAIQRGQRTARYLKQAALQVLRAPQWQALRWGLALLLLVQVAGLNVWAWQQKQSLHARRQAAREVLTQTFPSIQVVVDAPLQMQREVETLRRAAGVASPEDFAPMLAAVATALPQGQSASSMDYANGVLRMGGLQLTEADLQEVGARLASSPWRAHEEEGTLIVQVKGAL